VQTARRLYYAVAAMKDDKRLARDERTVASGLTSTSTDDDPLGLPAQAGAPAPAPRAPRRARLWLERTIILAVAVAALLIPPALGFVLFLAAGDGLRINAGDPFREVRAWMIQESAGATGLALSISQPAASPQQVACARTRVHFLKWDGGARREPDADYCQCYERRSGAWALSTATCLP